MTSNLDEIKKELLNKANPERAKINQSFFKTQKGEYGFGDRFLGIRTLELRKIAKQFQNLTLKEIEHLLTSEWNEERELALFILVNQYNKSSKPEKEKIVGFYLEQTPFINNWNLVDSSAHQILGEHTHKKGEHKILLALSGSKNIWERRISIVATYAFIKQGNYAPTLQIAEKLMNDTPDLIHKATGWMLREVGKKEIAVLKQFLDRHATNMPRTMLRYAIERMSEEERQNYLKRKK